jgi:hypothetical protein
MRITRESRIENQRRWEEHVRVAQDHPEGYADYCRKNQISVATLNYWRNKMRVRKVSDTVQRPAFIPIQVISEGNQSAVRGLPDPKWVAELILHLTAKVGE